MKLFEEVAKGRPCRARAESGKAIVALGLGRSGKSLGLAWAVEPKRALTLNHDQLGPGEPMCLGRNTFLPELVADGPFNA